MFGIVAFWGVSWPIGREIATAELGPYPFTAAFIRFTFALPILYILAKLVDKDLKIPRAYLPKIAILGLLQISIYNLFFLSGLRYTSSSDAVLIINGGITIITAVVSARLYVDETITLQKVFGISLSIVGVVIIFLLSPNQDVENRLLGNILILGAALTWSLYTAFSKPIYRDIQALTFQLYATIFGWLFLGVFTLFEQINNPSETITSGSVYRLLYLGIFAAAIANTLFSLGVKYLGPIKTSIFINFVPLAGVISSVLLLNETFSLWYILVFALIFLGVYIVNRSK